MLTKEQTAKRVAAYNAGLSDYEAAQACGIATMTYKQWRYRYSGIYQEPQPKPKRQGEFMTPELLKKMIDLRCQGLTFKDISQRVGVSFSSMRKYLYKAGYR